MNSSSSFAETKLDKLQAEISKATGKRIGCSDYFYGNEERFEECYQAVKRAGDAVKRIKQMKSETIHFFEGVTIFKDGAEEYFPNFRDSNNEGDVGFLVDDSLEVMVDWLLSMMNDYRKLDRLKESAYVSKGDGFPVWVHCDNMISFNDCIWGVNTLKVALQDPELLGKVRDNVASITVSNKYDDPYVGTSYLTVRYKRKVAAMREELKNGLAKIN